MKLKYPGIIACFFILLIASCKKDAGRGGTSTIRGKIKSMKYDNTYSLLLAEYYIPDEDVYIIYGNDDDIYDDDFKTSHDGSYEFKYLQKGKYRIFAYTTDTAGLSVLGSVDENKPKIPVFRDVEITDKNQTIEVPEIVILEN